MLDYDLAELYEVGTKVLNQAVKRHIKRFPEDFMFQLTESEWSFMRSQNVTSSQMKRKHSTLPYAHRTRYKIIHSQQINSFFHGYYRPFLKYPFPPSQPVHPTGTSFTTSPSVEIIFPVVAFHIKNLL
ncbi:MAG: ORF6N domain-containing protein [Chitinophagaceae bacterium]|nr:ORF6N domain-containing protein [Chitinophagaceae bacterium]